MESMVRVMLRSSESVARFAPTLARLLALVAVALATYLEIRLSAH
jgi:hypothetical protein